MNEFIDKLIGRLEEKIKENTNDDMSYKIPYFGLEIALNIVKELAEEHKGGWIPCSERLPSYDGPFICTAKGIKESLELIYSSWDNSWMDEFYSEYEVIAWQPLPDPYKEK